MANTTIYTVEEGTGALVPIALPVAGKALIECVDPSAQRTAMGLGDLATQDVIAASSITSGTVAPSQLGSGSGGSTKFLREDSTWQAVAGGSPAFAVGGVYINVTGVNPLVELGYGVWTAFGSGRVLVGHNVADTDFDTAEETGGAKTVAGAGSNAAEAAHTHSVTSNVTVADHASHTHTYTEVPNHTHVIAAGQGSHQHGLAEGTTDGSGTFMDRSNAAAATTAVTDLATLPQMVTNNPTGGVASGTTAGPSAALSHSPVNNAVTSGGGASHNHAFTGSPTSVVQPYIVVHFWKRTA